MATFHATRVHAGSIIVCAASFPWCFATACFLLKDDIVSYEGSNIFGSATRDRGSDEGGVLPLLTRAWCSEKE